MAWAKRTATDYRDCLSQIVDFTTKAWAAGSVTAGGGNTGDGIVYGQSASENSVAETWTITCTTGGGSEVATFSVTGSVSGAKASAVADTPYSIDEVSFVVLSGDTDFVIGDTFSFTVSAITPQWSVNESDLISTQQYVLLQGTGGGSDEIFTGFRTHSNDSTYWNMEVSAFSGYVNGNNYSDQPGRRNYYTCMSAVSFDFWIFTTGYSIKVVPIVGTVYGGMYTGWFLPNATNAQYRYPAYVGGSTDDSNQLVGGTEDDHTNYWRGYNSEYSGAVNDGTTWNEINKFIPLSYGDFDKWFPDVHGNRVAYPVEVVKESQSSIYGRLEGLYYPTNADSLLTANDFLNQGSKGLIVFQDTFRVGAGNVVAVDLLPDA